MNNVRMFVLIQAHFKELVQLFVLEGVVSKSMALGSEY